MKKAAFLLFSLEKIRYIGSLGEAYQLSSSRSTAIQKKSMAKQRKIVVLDELLSRYSWLDHHLEKHRLAIIEARDGEDLFNKVVREHPDLCLMHVSMESMTANEVSRNIKAVEPAMAVKILCISDVVSLGLEDDARESGVDLYVSESEAPTRLVLYIKNFLKGNLPDNFEGSSEDQRQIFSVRNSQRFDVEGLITYESRTAHGEGDFVNLSRGGALFQCADRLSLGTKLYLEWVSPEQGEMKLKAIVVRLQALPDQKKKPFLVGTKFKEVDYDTELRLENILMSLHKLEEKELPPLTVEEVKGILESGIERVKLIFEKQDVNPYLEKSVGELSEYERTAFISITEFGKVIQGLVANRVKCKVLELFLPHLREYPSIYAPDIVPSMASLLFEMDRIEEQADALVRKAVDGGDEKTRNYLNNSSNRLFNTKSKLLREMDRILSNMPVHSSFAKDLEIVKKYVKRAVSYESMPPEVMAQKTKYSPAVYSPTGARRVNGIVYSPESIAESQKTKSSWLVLLAAIAVIAYGGYEAMVFLNRLVPKEQYRFSFEPIRIERDRSYSLSFYVGRENWQQLEDWQQKSFLNEIEILLTKDHLKQAKVLDPMGNLLAAVYSNRGKRSRRLYRSQIF